MSSAKWHPNTGQWGIFGTAAGSEARERRDRYGTHDNRAGSDIRNMEDQIQDSMGGLQDQLDSYTGSGGFIDRQKSIRDTKIKQTYDTGMRSIGANQSSFVDSIASQRGKSDLAYSGSTTRREKLGLNEYNDQRKDTSTNLQLNMEESRLSAEKEELDVVSNIRDKMNNLLSTWYQTTEKGLVEEGQFKALKEELDNYGGT
mgnify:CR=1 FL=1|tara:strand:- start:4154 stop:4756 length:603 start_codon:yes stop_codon:yes gene_type:complete